MNRTSNPRIGASSQDSKRLWLWLLILVAADPALAEVLSANTPLIRLRLGDNVVGSTNTVVYNAGIPAAMGGLVGVTAAPVAVSNTPVAGGSGIYAVRIVTDLNARNGVRDLEGRFSYDSSVPMSCVTPATCGGSTISFQRIRWTVRDGDTHTVPTQFDGTANQVAQIQRDTNPSANQRDTRHRNYLQYAFDNLELLPAGTYEGTITLNGTGTF